MNYSFAILAVYLLLLFSCQTTPKENKTKQRVSVQSDDPCDTGIMFPESENQTTYGVGVTDYWDTLTISNSDALNILKVLRS